MLDPERAAGVTVRVGLRVGEDFFFRLDDGAVAIGRGVPEDADVVLTGETGGVAAPLYAGVPIDADKEFTGTVFTLLNPFGLLGGLVTLTLFATHGAMFVALKTDGDIRHRARDLAVRIGAVAAVLAAFPAATLESITKDRNHA